MGRQRVTETTHRTEGWRQKWREEHPLEYRRPVPWGLVVGLCLLGVGALLAAWWW